MGLMDTLKGLLGKAGEHSDQVKGGLDKAADMVNEKTEGKFADKIDMAKDKAGDMIDQQGDGAAEAAADAAEEATE